MPWLFSKALFYYGEPISIPRHLSPDEVESYRLRVEETLNRLSEEAESNFDRLYDSV